MNGWNVLYIHTHDSGRIIGPYGYRTKTPNLESFASNALVFQQCYCVGPTCSPSRAGMLSGMYPHQTGMLGLAQRGFTMDYSKHLVQFLNRNGYRTVLSGVQHECGMYLQTEGSGEKIGYQEVVSEPSVSSIREADRLVQWDKKNAENLCEWLENYKGDAPFFLSYGMNGTHRVYPKKDEEIDENMAVPPYPIPNNADTRRDYAQYLTTLKYSDQCVGMVLDALEKTGHKDDTIVFFTTDHGVAFPFCKCTLFDSGIGVSFIMRVPGKDAKVGTTDRLVSHVDVFPTLCDLLELEKPDYLEGKSFAEEFAGKEENVRDAVFAEINFHTSYEPVRCVRTERYKYIKYFDKQYLRMNKSNIDESMTKAYYMERDLDSCGKEEEALYDLLYDPGERNNVIGEERYEDVLAQMREKLAEHMRQTKDILLDGPIEIKPEWKVNKKECLTASSKEPSDYVSLGNKK